MTRWWYSPSGQVVGYLADDLKWFYTQSGQVIGYRHGRWIYEGTAGTTPLGYFDRDGKWIYDTKSNQPLGYLNDPIGDPDAAT